VQPDYLLIKADGAIAKKPFETSDIKNPNRASFNDGLRLGYSLPFQVRSICDTCARPGSFPDGIKSLPLVEADETSKLLTYRMRERDTNIIGFFHPETHEFLKIKAMARYLNHEGVRSKSFDQSVSTTTAISMSSGIPVGPNRIDFYEMTESYILMSYDIAHSLYTKRGEIKLPLDLSKVPVVDLDEVLKRDSTKP